MKTFINVLFIAIITSAASGQSKSMQIESNIKSVRVFFQNAQISRSAIINIPNGVSKLEVNGLSPFINENSIKASINGEITILSVNHQLDFTAAKSINSIEHQLIQLNDSIAYQKMLLGVNVEEENFF